MPPPTPAKTTGDGVNASAQPAVSVVVPCYNVAAYLAEAVQSVAAQEFADFKVIIVDDGSPDDIAGAAAPFLADPRFRLTRIANRGLPGARNHGIALSTAPLIALLDGDDRFRPGYLRHMVGALAAHPDAAFATCDAISFGAMATAGERFSERYPQASPVTLERLLRRETHIFGLCTIRRSVLDSVGGYDETLGASEDLDLWLRILAGGAHGVVVNQPLVDYRRHASSLSANRSLLMQTTTRAFAKVLETLGDSPLASLAQSRRDEAAAIAGFEQGIDVVLAGEPARGVSQMRDSGYRSGNWKWGIAFSLFRLIPALAPPVLALYRQRRSN